jgi:hypothetical protein
LKTADIPRFAAHIAGCGLIRKKNEALEESGINFMPPFSTALGCY